MLFYFVNLYFMKELLTICFRIPAALIRFISLIADSLLFSYRSFLAAIQRAIIVLVAYFLLYNLCPDLQPLGQTKGLFYSSCSPDCWGAWAPVRRR